MDMMGSTAPMPDRWRRITGGGQRTTNVNPGQMPVTRPGGATLLGGATPYNPTSLDSNVGKFQGYAREGVEGYGAMLGEDFTKSVGGMLGDLNSIGALRSGGVVSGMNDLTTNYARQIGNVAKTATLDATSMGQSEYDANIERKYRDDAEKRARRGGFLRGVGTLLGGAGGFMIGGPAGAMAGAKIGGSAAGSFG